MTFTNKRIKRIALLISVLLNVLYLQLDYFFFFSYALVFYTGIASMEIAYHLFFLLLSLVINYFLVLKVLKKLTK
jgi:hypothetical protein